MRKSFGETGSTKDTRTNKLTAALPVHLPASPIHDAVVGAAGSSQPLTVGLAQTRPQLLCTAKKMISTSPVITFVPDGTARCLWTEAVPLHELGRLEVTRASNIEFNNSTQRWELKDRTGKVRFVAQSRSACLQWEQHHLQALT
jgi:hypothetical protein